MQDPAPMTLEAFLAWEAQQEGPHEFEGGRVQALSSPTKRHNRIAFNLAKILDRGVPATCSVFIERVKVIAAQDVYYPDVVVTCDERDERDEYIVRHPRIVAEVLSPRTRGADLTDKLRAYSALPSLAHYLVIEQAQRAVIHYAFGPYGAERRFEVITQGVIDLGFSGVLVELDALYAGIRVTKGLQ